MVLAASIAGGQIGSVILSPFSANAAEQSLIAWHYYRLKFLKILELKRFYNFIREQLHEGLPHKETRLRASFKAGPKIK